MVLHRNTEGANSMNTTTALRTAYRIPAWSNDRQEGERHIYSAPDYTGSTVTVARLNDRYLSVTARPVIGAFKTGTAGLFGCGIWHDQEAGRWVVDYNEHGEYIVVTSTRSLLAAINYAVGSASERGRIHGYW